MNGKTSSCLKNPLTVGAVAMRKILKQHQSLLTMTFFGLLMFIPAMQVYADPPTTGDLFSGGKDVVKRAHSQSKSNKHIKRYAAIR